MFGRKEPIVTPELDEIPSRPPVEYQPPNLKPDGSNRDAVIAAAREHDRQERVIAEQATMLLRAKAEIDAAIHQVEGFKLQIAELLNYVASYKNERDEAVQDRANVAAILANIKAIVDSPDIPLPPRRRRNGRHADASVAVEPVGGGPASPLQINIVGTGDEAKQRLSDEERG